MKDSLFLKSLNVRNLLSFGEDGQEIDLLPLNVLIGPNTSGKSNLIEIIGLLKAAAIDLVEPVVRGGGFREWVWKGGGERPRAEVQAVLEPLSGEGNTLRYKLAFSEYLQNRFTIVEERLEDEAPGDSSEEGRNFYYKFEKGRAIIVPMLSRQLSDIWHNPPEPLELDDINKQQSALSQLRDPVSYPELTKVAAYFRSIHLYREWSLGTDTPVRRLQRVDAPAKALRPDGANLSMVLNDLQNKPETKAVINLRLREFYPDVEDVRTRVQGGYVELLLYEKGLKEPIPAARLSDGTLRYLCLLAILCHPEPPPLVCIEEPELGFHPNMLQTVAGLLREASKRTQIVVSTHSDLLVSALADHSESVLICEKTVEGTHLRRLEAERLKSWLKRYTLGELWLKGKLSGNRGTAGDPDVGRPSGPM